MCSVIDLKDRVFVFVAFFSPVFVANSFSSVYVTIIISSEQFCFLNSL
jgi:hypothetical protein